MAPHELATLTEELGITLTSEQLTLFDRYAQLLEEWNGRIDLTSVPRQDYESRHFADSLAIAQVVEMGTVRTVIDVGSGAGFPGVPLAIAFPHLETVLLDATRKRVEFLQTVIQELKLPRVRALHGRAEEYGRDPLFRERFDLVTARAVAQLNQLVEYLLPLCAVGGRIVCFKGEDVAEEARTAARAIETLGGSSPTMCRYKIAGSPISRTLVQVQKISATTAPYPRSAAKIGKAPL